MKFLPNLMNFLLSSGLPMSETFNRRVVGKVALAHAFPITSVFSC
jgi:hypothetical protein